MDSISLRETMNRLQDNRTIQERACDLEKVVTFAIMSTIKNCYNSDVDSLKQIYSSIVNGTCSSDVQVKFCSRFKCLTRNEAADVLGDGWTVDVIAHILSGLKK